MVTVINRQLAQDKDYQDWLDCLQAQHEANIRAGLTVEGDEPGDIEWLA